MDAATRFWERKAESYDAKLPAKGVNYAARLDRIAARLPDELRGEAALLDVGCATGQITLDVAERHGPGLRVTGLDVSTAMIEQCRRKAEQRGLTHARFLVGGPDVPELARERFDVVTCFSVLHLVDDWRATLGQMVALTKPGGWLVTETPCLGDWGPWWGPVLGTMRAIGVAPRVGRLRVRDLEAAFRDAGCDVVESTVHNPKSGMHCITAQRRAL